MSVGCSRCPPNWSLGPRRTLPDRSDFHRYTCLATSTDGVHWTKPHLGVSTFMNSTANNIVWPRDYRDNTHAAGTVFIDTNPAAPAAGEAGSRRRPFLLTRPSEEFRGRELALRCGRMGAGGGTWTWVTALPSHAAPLFCGSPALWLRPPSHKSAVARRSQVQDGGAVEHRWRPPDLDERRRRLHDAGIVHVIRPTPILPYLSASSLPETSEGWAVTTIVMMTPAST